MPQQQLDITKILQSERDLRSTYLRRAVLLYCCVLQGFLYKLLGSSSVICGDMYTAEEVFKCSKVCSIGYNGDTSDLVLQNDWESYSENVDNAHMSQDICILKAINQADIIKNGPMTKRNRIFVALSDILVTEIDDRLGQVQGSSMSVTFGYSADD